MGLLDRLNTGPSTPNGTAADAHAQTVARYRGLLLHEIDLGELSKLDAGQRRLRLERVMGHLLSREGPILSGGERQAIIRRVVDEALGLGILEPLLADPSVTEIMVNGHETIFVERAGVLQRLDAHFANEDQLMQTIDRIVAGVNRRVDESSPMVDARLSSGERVNVIVPPLALDGPMLTIRRFPRAYSLAELVDKGAMDGPTALLLGSFVRARCNVIVSGGTGTGKTTMLNALSGFIPGHERIVTIEDAAELRLQQEHVIRLESRPPNVEGKGQVTIRDLVRNSLRMRPDRIIVGEVRGGETLDMLQAMNTGHEGSMATVHANSSDDAMMRLETLASMSEISIPYEALRDQINNAVDVVVQLSRQADGSRKVTEVAAVSSRRREDFALATVATYQALPLEADRVVRGTFRQHPLPPALAERLLMAGETLPHPFRAAAHPDELMIRRAT